MGMAKDSFDKAEVEDRKTGKILGSVNSSFSIPTTLSPSTIYFSANTISFGDNVTGNTHNAGFYINKFLPDLYSIIEKVTITIKGSSSNAYTFGPPCITGMTKDSVDISEDRANDTLLYIQTGLAALLPSSNAPKDKEDAINNLTSTTLIKLSPATTVEGCAPEDFQTVTIEVKYDPKKDKTLTLTNATVDNVLTNNSKSVFLRRTVPLCEAEYFEAMDESDRFALYTDLRKRLDYFHPSFHSITPEGFNSRLTFLLQCTRQGPSIQNETGPTNMAFGRPPICVLRIGDFYYTKVVIDSVNISYDDNLFDLNPEGIGIQPMIATVDLNMKVIGGSSLEGPKDAALKLQNALSWHFFANTEVYMGAPLIKATEEKPEPVTDDQGTKVDNSTKLNEPTTADLQANAAVPEATEPVGIYPSGFTSNFIQCTLRQDGSGDGFLPR